MIWVVIKTEIQAYISDIKSKNQFSVEEESALRAIEIYACRNLAGAKTSKLAALKSILNANSEVCKSGIYGFLPIFNIIHNYCVVEAKNLNEPLYPIRPHVVNINQSSYNVSKKTEEKNSLRKFFFVPLIIVVLIAFFSIISENRQKRRSQELQEYLQETQHKSKQIAQQKNNEELSIENKKESKSKLLTQNAESKDRDKSKKTTKINPVKIKEPDYVETYFVTGDAPYKSFFGKGIYDHKSLSELKIINYSSYDAVVLLEHSIKGIIRNVYVKKDFTYTMKNIPEGICIIRIMHGNSWNNDKDNGPNFPKGGFMKNVSFEKTKWDDPFNFKFKEDSEGISYPTYSITLHKVRNGNLQTERIDEESFWN